MKVKETMAQWRARNPGLVRAHRKAYKARKKGAAHRFYATPEKIQARFSYFGNVCVYCGGKAEEMDHVIALVLGGLHLPANIVPACRHCNRVKSDKSWRGFPRRPL